VPSLKASCATMFWQHTCENKLSSLTNVYCVVANSFKESANDCELHGNLNIHFSSSMTFKYLLNELTV
jgi:hypothetical protein